MADETEKTTDKRSAKEKTTDALLSRVAKQWSGGEHVGAARTLSTGFKGLGEADQRALVARAEADSPGITEHAGQFVTNEPPK